jgi:hypothetical protein
MGSPVLGTTTGQAVSRRRRDRLRGPDLTRRARARAEHPAAAMARPVQAAHAADDGVASGRAAISPSPSPVPERLAGDGSHGPGRRHREETM